MHEMKKFFSVDENGVFTLSKLQLIDLIVIDD